MARKVILDVDPGIDDAVALCIALFDPRLDVVAVTATAGAVPADLATRNVQAVIEHLDPPRCPRIGTAREPEDLRVAEIQHLDGADGLGEAHFQVSELHHQHPSEKVICDEVRAAPDEITVISLGPLTNLARVIARDPELASQIGSLHMMGGSLAGGNATAAAEFNIYCDPVSARTVFRSATTKSLIPLNITEQVVMTYDQLNQLPPASSRVGGFLHKILSYAFRSHRMKLGLEGIYLHSAVALVAALNRELFRMSDLAGDVETSGELTVGATVFDRRVSPRWRRNMEVATEVDVAGVMDCILRGLRAAGGR